MQTHHVALGAVILVALAGGVYQGCLSSPASTEAELGVIGPEPGPELPLLVPADAGPFTAIEPSIPGVMNPPIVPGPIRCGGLACPEGQMCCPSTGECFAPSCDDCCPLPTAAPALPGSVPDGEEPMPDLARVPAAIDPAMPPAVDLLGPPDPTH